MDELRLYRTVLATSGELVWAVDLTGRWTFLSASAARRIYGCDPSELIGRPFIEVTAPELRERDFAVFRRVLEGQAVTDFETRHLRSDGEMIDLECNMVPVRDADGRVVGAAGTARDVTGRKRAEAARLLPFHDSSTGLPNRRLFDDRLEQALQLARRHQRRLAVLLLRLDDARGEALLQDAAQRLAGAVRKADTVARHGAREFALLLAEVRSSADCGEAAERVLGALAQAELPGGASIGISLFPDDAGDAQALLRNAEAALERARQAGPGRFALFRT